MELTQKSEFGSHNTFQGRLQYHEKLLDLVKENPVVGYGLGTAGYTSKITYPPHNDYLRIALESGVPGMLLYIVFLLKELFDHIQRVRTTMFGLVHFSSLILIVYFIILSFFQKILGIFAISAKLHFLEKHQKISFSD
jgi:O-antigen ligase